MCGDNQDLDSCPSSRRVDFGCDTAVRKPWACAAGIAGFQLLLLLLLSCLNIAVPLPPPLFLSADDGFIHLLRDGCISVLSLSSGCDPCLTLPFRSYLPATPSPPLSSLYPPFRFSLRVPGERTISSFTLGGASVAKQSFARITPDMKENEGSIFSRLTGRFNSGKCGLLLLLLLLVLFLLLAAIATQRASRRTLIVFCSLVPVADAYYSGAIYILYSLFCWFRMVFLVFLANPLLWRTRMQIRFQHGNRPDYRWYPLPPPSALAAATTNQGPHHASPRSQDNSCLFFRPSAPPPPPVPPACVEQPRLAVLPSAPLCLFCVLCSARWSVLFGDAVSCQRRGGKGARQAPRGRRRQSGHD